MHQVTGPNTLVSPVCLRLSVLHSVMRFLTVLQTVRSEKRESFCVFSGSTGREIKTVCGTSPPGDILTNSDRIVVKFVSDLSIERPGFKLRFRTSTGRRRFMSQT